MRLAIRPPSILLMERPPLTLLTAPQQPILLMEPPLIQTAILQPPLILQRLPPRPSSVRIASATTSLPTLFLSRSHPLLVIVLSFSASSLRPQASLRAISASKTRHLKPGARLSPSAQQHPLRVKRYWP